ncbi:response regulator [Falsirhodobacter halotolerans]|uniref:response regulator n=1 Tax=Falsirhodobacter halotolerans TaxID=1146892 RepID=UPI001FD1214D|nr:response regulator [Falsirhodobacter halotolerans]
MLVVEDEPLIAMLMEDYLSDLGYSVIGPARGVSQGLSLLQAEAVDFAVLDVNLAGEVSFPIADALADRGIPFIFASANSRACLTPRHCDAPMLGKPFALADLERVLGGADLHHV